MMQRDCGVARSVSRDLYLFVVFTCFGDFSVVEANLVYHTVPREKTGDTKTFNTRAIITFCSCEVLR